MTQPAGRRDRRIVIEKDTATPGDTDGHGTQIQTWTPFAERWAQVIETGGAELEAAQATNAEVTVLFKLLHLAGVTPAMRVIYKGRTFDVIRALEVGRAVGLNILGKERRA